MMFLKSPIAKRTRVFSRGSVLLEVMLASAILALSLTGFVVALQKCIEASKASRVETRLRNALQSRMAEMRAETVNGGKRTYYYYGEEVAVEQTILSSGFRSAEGSSLPGLFRAVLLAKSAASDGPCLQTETLFYLP